MDIPKETPMTAPTPDQFFTGVTTRPLTQGGNTQWAANKAKEIQYLVRRSAERDPRSQQKHVGPSELGVECDRQVVEKLLGNPATNHVSDPWPSIIGRSVHAYLAEAFESSDPIRWLTEKAVTPIDGHAGTADLYDEYDHAVLDHKVLGASSLSKIKQGKPPRKYVAQLGLYGLGYMRMGKRVDRIGIVGYPRTAATLDELYVWEHPMDEALMSLIKTVVEDTKRRKNLAILVKSELLPLSKVPRKPSPDECFFCPFFRPGGGDTGCPGTAPVT